MTDTTSTIKGWDIARTALTLFINDKTEEAKALFKSHPDNFHVKIGHCFAKLVDTLMTFEEDKIKDAAMTLKSMERECTSDAGWMQYMKSKIFKSEETGQDYVTKWEKQIFLAELQVCSMILMGIQQEIASAIHAAWTLHGALRVYQHAYKEILKLYQRTFGTSPSALSLELPMTCDTPSSTTSITSSRSSQSLASSEQSIRSCNDLRGNGTPTSQPSGLRSSLSMFFSLTGITSEQQTPFVEPTEVARLMAMASFGYGLYQLFLSLMPLPLRKMSKTLGFACENNLTALSALNYVRLSKDMHAPIATVSLLWYHTVIRPSIVSDNTELAPDIETAKQLISDWGSEFNNSALVFYFTGRVKRIETHVSEALEAFAKAAEIAGTREVRLLIVYDQIWCHLSCQNYEEAYRGLSHMLQYSRWARLITTYQAAVCCGVRGKFDDFTHCYQKICNAKTANKLMPLDHFAVSRSSKLLDQSTRQLYPAFYYKLLIYELLYLLSYMECCPRETLEEIASECKDDRTHEPVVGLADLIEGTAYRYLGNKNAAFKCYKNCLRRRGYGHCSSNNKNDLHIDAMALFEIGCLLCKTNVRSKIQRGKRLLLLTQQRYRDHICAARMFFRIQATLDSIR